MLSIYELRISSNRYSSGFSLLEVLISIFVVLVGLLGVASMIPAGRFEINEARKLDMGGNMGKAMLRSVVTQLSDANFDPARAGYYIVSTSVPAGITNQLNAIGLQPITRTEGVTGNTTTLMYNNTKLLDGDDDLYWDVQENQTLLYSKVSTSANGAWSNETGFSKDNVIGSGKYSGLITMYHIGDGYYEVSSAVGYHLNGATITTLTQNGTFDPSIGGGLWTAAGEVNLERGQWVLLFDANNRQLHWYKIENAFLNNANQYYVTLNGPDWNARTNACRMYIPGQIVSTYTRVMRLGK